MSVDFDAAHSFAPLKRLVVNTHSKNTPTIYTAQYNSVFLQISIRRTNAHDAAEQTLGSLFFTELR